MTRGVPKGPPPQPYYDPLSSANPGSVAVTQAMNEATGTTQGGKFDDDGGGFKDTVAGGIGAIVDLTIDVAEAGGMVAGYIAGEIGDAPVIGSAIDEVKDAAATGANWLLQTPAGEKILEALSQFDRPRAAVAGGVGQIAYDATSEGHSEEHQGVYERTWELVFLAAYEVNPELAGQVVDWYNNGYSSPI
jgi:hypothetical protein